MRLNILLVVVSLFAVLLFFLGFVFPGDLEKEITYEHPGFIQLALHNLKAEITSIFFGIVTLGVYSITYLFINFISMGLITSTSLMEASLPKVLNMFIAHGIFEIPAMILTTSLGIYAPWKMVGMLKRRKADYLIFRKMANIFAIIFLLTITAAFIESFITPVLIGDD